MKTAPMDRSKPPGFRSGLLIAQISFFSHESKAKDSGKIIFFVLFSFRRWVPRFPEDCVGSFFFVFALRERERDLCVWDCGWDLVFV